MSALGYLKYTLEYASVVIVVVIVVVVVIIAAAASAADVVVESFNPYLSDGNYLMIYLLLLWLVSSLLLRTTSCRVPSRTSSSLKHLLRCASMKASSLASLFISSLLVWYCLKVFA